MPPPYREEHERQKAASFRTVNRKLKKRQVIISLLCVAALLLITFAGIEVLKNSPKVVQQDDISVSIADGSLIAQLSGSVWDKAHSATVTVQRDGREQTYLFFYLTMQNTGLSLALAIYLFSIANCLVITNYCIISRRREMAVRKAFGWSNRHLTELVVAEMAQILAISLCISVALLALLSHWNQAMFQIHLSPLFVTSTLVLLTLALSITIPMIRILNIHPAEVIA